MTVGNFPIDENATKIATYTLLHNTETEGSLRTHEIKKKRNYGTFFSVPLEHYDGRVKYSHTIITSTTPTL